MASKLIIAEDHPLIVKSIKLLLYNIRPELECVTTDNCSDLMKLIKLHQPEFCITDLSLVDGMSLGTLENMLSLYPDIHVMVYTAFPGELYAKRLLNLGIHGFLNKNAEEEEVVEALKKLLQKEFYVSPNILPLLISNKKNIQSIANQFNLLSEKELQVVEFLRTGESVKNIAAQMGIMPNTVATYKKRAFEKLSVQNIVQLNHLYPGNRTQHDLDS